MGKPYIETVVRLYVDPDQLRKMAAQMETHMDKAHVGDRVWSERFYGDNDLCVELLADQTWFDRHRRD